MHFDIGSLNARFQPVGGVRGGILQFEQAPEVWSAPLGAVVSGYLANRQAQARRLRK